MNEDKKAYCHKNGYSQSPNNGCIGFDCFIDNKKQACCSKGINTQHIHWNDVNFSECVWFVGGNQVCGNIAEELTDWTVKQRQDDENGKDVYCKQGAQPSDAFLRQSVYKNDCNHRQQYGNTRRKPKREQDSAACAHCGNFPPFGFNVVTETQYGHHHQRRHCVTVPTECRFQASAQRKQEYAQSSGS